MTRPGSESREALQAACEAIEGLLCGFVWPRPDGEPEEITRVTRECHANVAQETLAHCRKVLDSLASGVSSETPAKRLCRVCCGNGEDADYDPVSGWARGPCDSCNGTGLAADPIAHLREPPATACINCGEKNDGGYVADGVGCEGAVGPFCSQCWQFLHEQLQTNLREHGGGSD